MLCVAPEIKPHLVPVRVQRSHRNANVVGRPVNVQVVAVNVFPTATVPRIVGRVVIFGGVVPLRKTPVPS
jgi:hypothetical protein